MSESKATPDEWQQGVAALATLLPLFEDPGAEAGGAVEARQRVALQQQWMRIGFDRQTWAKSAEFARIRDNTAELECADASTLAKVLTVLIRKDRVWGGFLEDERTRVILLAVVRRAATLDAGFAKP